MEKVFVGNGIGIEKHDNDYYMIYDAGEICDRIEKIQITEEEAILAQKSSMDVYNIIIKHQNETIFGNRK